MLENTNGLLFDHYEDLVNNLTQLFEDYPSGNRLKEFRDHLESNFCKLDWDANWRTKALPIFQK